MCKNASAGYKGTATSENASAGCQSKNIVFTTVKYKRRRNGSYDRTRDDSRSDGVGKRANSCELCMKSDMNYACEKRVMDRNDWESLKQCAHKQENPLCSAKQVYSSSPRHAKISRLVVSNFTTDNVVVSTGWGSLGII
jgi:hypothetical protein